MDCYGHNDCASNFRCAGGRCIENRNSQQDETNQAAGCGFKLPDGQDFKLPKSWVPPGDRQPCGNYQTIVDGVITSVSAGPCPKGQTCSGNFCVPDWNDPLYEFPWEEYDEEDPETWPYDPEDPETYPDEEDEDCGKVPQPAEDTEEEEDDKDEEDESGPLDEEDSQKNPFPELDLPKLPNLNDLFKPAAPPALSCDDEPNCGTKPFGFTMPEIPNTEFPEIPFDITDPSTWPDEEEDEEFDPKDKDTWPPDEEDFLDEAEPTGNCKEKCEDGKWLVEGKCEQRPCSKYCTELYKTDPRGLADEMERCPPGSFCTGQCQDCEQVPNRPAPGPLLYDKGWCVSRAKAQFDDENGDGIPDADWTPEAGQEENPLPYGGVHCKCLTPEEIPACWKCDSDGVIRPDPANCQVCVTVDNWECSCGPVIGKTFCRAANERKISAEWIRDRLAEECARLCPVGSDDACAPACTYVTRQEPGPVSSFPCPPSHKCSVVGTIINDSTGGYTYIIEQCDYSDLPARCECNSVECVCHSECPSCSVCTEEGKCVADPAAPPECCPDPAKKRVRQRFKITKKVLPTYSCDGILIAQGSETVQYTEFNEIGVVDFDLPSVVESATIQERCDEFVACEDLQQKQLGKVYYDYYIEGSDKPERRNWYVGSFYQGLCRGVFERVTFTTVELSGDPIITCEA